jgi:pimeloyl-ACP methyl ester carboxylesterase
VVATLFFVVSLAGLLLGPVGSPGLTGVAKAGQSDQLDLSGLESCGRRTVVLCGTISRLLDPEDPSGATIDINFELYPARNHRQPPLGTIVAVEGGPGYASTASRDYYLELFDPLLSQRQLLLVDNRGTGYSGAIDCPELQSYEGDYLANIKLCGEQLGDTSDLYGSALAADDMAAVLDALAISQIDLYGDSYGTFFAQTFAVRHPERVRTVVLDAAYPVEDQDPWYRDINRAVVDAFGKVCERDPGCAALGNDPIETLEKLASALEAEPLEGSAPDADGIMRDVFLDAPMLSYLTGVATYGVPVYRELDAAARAYLDLNDPLPLLRIAAEQNYYGDAGLVEEFSEGLYIATICNDYPQLWDINSPLADRPAQFEAARLDLIAREPEAFAPYTIDQWLASPWTEFESCMGWPAPSNWVPPYPANHVYPDTPILVLVGDLDSITSPEGAEKAASFFPNSTFVAVANVAHVTALVDYSRCASDLVVRFVQTGGDAGDVSCAAGYNEIRVVEHFPATLDAVEVLPGVGTGAQGQAVIAAAHTMADMMSRWYSMYGEDGVGLRGGSFHTTGLTNVGFKMRDLKWVDDLEVNGTVRWDRATGAIIGEVTVTGAVSGSLSIRWNDWHPLAQAHAVGVVDGKRVNWWFAAP